MLNAGGRRQNGFPETVPEMAVVRAGPGFFSGGGGRMLALSALAPAHLAKLGYIHGGFSEERPHPMQDYCSFYPQNSLFQF